MYLTAHRVRTDDGTEGVNAFKHRQSRQTDPTQVADVLASIEQDAGILVAALCDVPPGRNHVLAYLDIVMADGEQFTERELQTARASFLPLLADQPTLTSQSDLFHAGRPLSFIPDHLVKPQAINDLIGPF